MRLMGILLAVVLVLGFTGITHAAATLFTPPVYAITPDQVECELVNVSGVTQKAQIIALNTDGGVNRDSGIMTLSAGQGSTLTSGSAGPQYCKFILISGAKSAWRGSIGLFGSIDNGSDRVALPAN